MIALLMTDPFHANSLAYTLSLVEMAHCAFLQTGLG